MGQNQNFEHLLEICSDCLLAICNFLHHLVFNPQGYCNTFFVQQHSVFLFTCEGSRCFQRVLAIAILSVCLSVCLSICHRVDQSKTVQARITKSLPSSAWKTLLSGTVKLFHKFEGGHPERGH